MEGGQNGGDHRGNALKVVFQKWRWLCWRCFRPVDFALDCPSKFIPIDKEANHEIVHAFRLGEADRPPYQPLNACAHVEVLALDLLGVCLPDCVLLGLQMPLVGPPTVGKIARDTKRFQEGFELQKGYVLASSTHLVLCHLEIV